MWTHKTPLPSTAPWGQTTPTLLTHHLRFPDGNLTPRIGEIREGHLWTEEEADNHPEHQDPLPAEVEAEVEAEVVAAVEGRSHFPGMHPPNLLKNSWEMHPPSSQEIEPRSTCSLCNGNY